METTAPLDRALAAPRAVTRWTSVLADRAQEDRFREAHLDVLRRDVQVVAAAVLAYNAWSATDELLASAGWLSSLGEAANNAVLLVAGVAVLLVVRRSRTWQRAASVLVAGVALYTAVMVWGVLGGLFSPQSAVLIAVMSAAVLYLHAQLPVVSTACLTLGWTLVSTASIAVAISRQPAASAAGSWDVLVEGVVLMVMINVVGLAATRRTATGERMLFAERERVQRLSATDPLTGAANRRRWEHHLDAAWERCGRDRSPLGLLLVDVDRFKAVNDRFGHSGGDDALRRVAELLGARAQRSGDLVARLGGDEFAVVLPQASAQAVRRVAEELVADVRALRAAAAEDDPAGVLSLSVGAASVVPRPGSAWEDAVAQADALLYRAKAQGRDRACCSDAGDAPAEVPGPALPAAGLTR